ncbi:Arc family DNA-binding protein [Oscillibacter sp.]|jgi:predicted DNA-binding protein|uniref:Arc family DNA-binding protein n=1 Tax=Oscillibacter sp. TaxID=1945593 RepID=UPI002170EFE7|nr:Arc family DNA-binding protein [Oscillibacter sp.]MCI9650242.1 Arc family DNA-binding protein [Oscillibacter sp.]
MPSKLPQYGLRIPKEIMDKLKYIANYSGRSANKEIEQLILAHIERWEREHGPITFDDGFVPRSRS